MGDAYNAVVSLSHWYTFHQKEVPLVLPRVHQDNLELLRMVTNVLLVLIIGQLFLDLIRIPAGTGRRDALPVLLTR